MFNRLKAYLLRRKAAKLAREINALVDARPDADPVYWPQMQASIINMRHEILIIERRLLAMGSAL